MYLSTFAFAVAMSCAVVEEMFHLSSLVGSRLDVLTDEWESARRSKCFWLRKDTSIVPSKVSVVFASGFHTGFWLWGGE